MCSMKGVLQGVAEQDGGDSKQCLLFIVKYQTIRYEPCDSHATEL